MAEEGFVPKLVGVCGNPASVRAGLRRFHSSFLEDFGIDSLVCIVHDDSVSMYASDSTDGALEDQCLVELGSLSHDEFEALFPGQKLPKP